MWTYDGIHPGATFNAVSRQPLSVACVNNLPSEHFLPVDDTVCGMKPAAQSVRNVVHVHGGAYAGGERWLSGGLVSTRPVGHCSLSKWAGGHRQ